MRCPKCGHQQPGNYECHACGIIFERYLQRQEQKASHQNQNLPAGPPAPGSYKTWLWVSCALLLGLTGGHFFGGESRPVVSLPEQSAKKNVSGPSEAESALAAPVAKFQPKTPSSLSPHDLADALTEKSPPNNDIEMARNATVFIKAPWGSGSGFFIDSHGHIITNRHVIRYDAEKLASLEKEAEELRLKLSDEEQNIAYFRSEINKLPDQKVKAGFTRQLQAREQNYEKYVAMHADLQKRIDLLKNASPHTDVKVILIDGQEYALESFVLSDRLDLALLSIYSSGTPFITTAGRQFLQQGQKVYTVGNPAGLKHTVTSGIISGFRKYQDNNFIQTDAPINPGNSGGPLLDEQGRVIGVNTMIMRDMEGIGFAIPIQEALREFSYQLSDY